jgi:hypothetical protein
MVSIDTLRFRIRQPIIDPTAGLTIVPLAQRRGFTSADKILKFEDSQDGTTQRIREAYMHQDFIHVSSISGYLMISVNVPQILALNVTSVQPATKDNFWAVLEFLEDWCKAYAGLEINILETELSRIDLFVNADSKYSFAEYGPLFELINFSRQINMRYSTSFYGFNAYRGTCIYDRGEKTLTVDHEATPSEGNLIRWEIRLKNARSIQRTLRIKTVYELMEHWDDLKPFYVNQIRKALRFDEELEQDSPVTDIKAEIAQLQREPNDMKAFYGWLMAHGARSTRERWPSIPDIKVVLKEMGYEGWQVRRLMVRYKDALTVRLAGDVVSINDLRNELFTKLSS